jgi:hypothetical protein
MRVRRLSSRILCLLLCIACSLPAAAADRLPFSATAPSGIQARGPEAAGAPVAVGRRHEGERWCRRSRDTIAFGWQLIEYGVATLKYAVGLLLIMLGGLLVLMGWLVSVVDWLWC